MIHAKRILLTTAVAGLLALPAQAWDPYEGADAQGYAATPQPRPISRIGSRPLSAPTPAVARAAPAVISPPPLPPMQLSMPTPAPAMASAPIYVPPAPPIAVPMPAPVSYAPPEQSAPVYAPPPAPVAAPAYQYGSGGAPTVYDPLPQSYTDTTDNAAYSTGRMPLDRLALGLEVYHDKYLEDSVGLESDALYGGVTAQYQHFYDPRWFGALEGRVAYGSDDYSSISGQVDGVPQWEFEARTLAGYRYYDGEGSIFDPYFGLGMRYYRDEFKGYETNLNAVGYDRRIFQLYLPVGFTHSYKYNNGWNFRQSYEFAALLYGNVSSRLRGTGLNFGNVENQQDPLSGYGVRGEMMFGKTDAQGTGFEFGPYLRYWDIGDSQRGFDPVSGLSGLEPENQRLQVGGTLRFLF